MTAPTNKNALREQGADTEKTYTAKNTARRGIKQLVKALIVGMAVRRLLPIRAADWIISWLHLEAE